MAAGVPVWLGLGLIWLIWWSVALLIPVRLRVRAGGATATATGWVEADVAWLLLRRHWRVNVDDAWLNGLFRRAGGWGYSLFGRRLSGAFRPLMAAGVPALHYLRVRLAIRRLRLSVAVGTGDSMSTALACGAAWSAAGALVGALSAAVPLPAGAARVEVCPSFGPAGLAGGVDCSAGIRPLHLLLAGSIFVRRGGLRALRNRARTAAHPRWHTGASG